jgi:hypothetical protein
MKISQSSLRMDAPAGGNGDLLHDGNLKIWNIELETTTLDKVQGRARGSLVQPVRDKDNNNPP